MNATSGQPRAFDWTAVRKRLESAREAVEAASQPVQADRARILKARAQALAQEPAKQQHAEFTIDVVEFMLAYERYAIDTAFVREVHPLKDITALPGAPPFVAGIVNVRGRIVTAIDMKRLFDLPAKGLTDFNKLIILDDGQMEFGLLVDAVLAVQRLALTDIQAGLPTLTGVRANYLQGVTAQRVVILNAAKLLADPLILGT